jgi:glycosyltransferase involved in cell wall biosynthesis
MKVAIDAVGIRGHGGAAVLQELLHWLPRARPHWKWHVFLFNRDLREFDDPPVQRNVSFEHTRNGNSGLTRLLWVDFQLQKRLKEINPDALFSFANIGPVKPSVPQVVFVQQTNAFLKEGIPRNDFLMRLRMKFIKKKILAGAKRSNAVIVQTETMRKRMLMDAPQLNDRIHVIPSGFRTPSLHPVIRPEKKVLIGNSSHPRLIYVSHPAPHKNHKTLMDAMHLIATKYPLVTLFLTVDIEAQNSRKLSEKKYFAYTRPIKEFYSRSRLKKNIVFLGWLTPDEVEYALKSSDLMVFPSLSESFGLGLVEAFAAGCPVVASNLTYARDVGGDAALYFDPKSPLSISETVADALESDGLRKTLKERGLERSRSYSYQITAEHIARVLEGSRM